MGGGDLEGVVVLQLPHLMVLPVLPVLHPGVLLGRARVFFSSSFWTVTWTRYTQPDTTTREGSFIDDDINDKRLKS